MLTKTNVMFFLGAVFTAIAVRLFAYPFVGPHLADRWVLRPGGVRVLRLRWHGEAGPVDRSDTLSGEPGCLLRDYRPDAAASPSWSVAAS